MKDDEPFSSSRLKLRRAMRHIQELEDTIDSYFSGDWYVLKSDIGKEGNPRFNFTLRKPPEEFDTIVGDAIHNIRSTLDLAAVELVRLNGGNTKGVMFPFARSEMDFSAACKKKNINRATLAAQELISSLRPYGGGNETLLSLHDLDIQDKHHTLIPNTSFVEFPPISVKLDENGRPIGFDEGELQIVIDANVPLKLDFIFPEDSPLKGQEIVSGLKRLHDEVTKIIDSFCLLY